MKFLYHHTHPDNTKLLLHCHGLLARKKSIKYWLQDCAEDFDVFAPALPHKRLLSFKRVSDIVDELVLLMNDLTSNKHYDSITLTGHSMGAQFIRELYGRAWIEIPHQKKGHYKFKRNPQIKWVDQVERVIYIGGFHRGWSIDSFVSRIRTAEFKALNFLAETLSFVTFGRIRATGLDTKSGDVNLISLRLKMLKLNKFLQTHENDGPDTIQILGAKDDMVVPNRQFDTMPDTKMRIIEIPNSGHTDILHTPSALGLSRETPKKKLEKDSKAFAIFRRKRKTWRHPRKRMQLLSKALHAKWDVILQDDNYCFGVKEFTHLPAEEDVTDLIFVIHGIRDKAFWTAKLGRFLRARAATNQSLNAQHRIFRTATPTYGYFPILDFVFPGLRKAKVAWLADQYVHYRGLYPNADFHYVGHSNGTQIFAEALEAHSDFKFKNVVLAGSVIRKDFQWENYLGGQVERVMNYVASADKVVAIFPKGLQGWKFFKLGSAGHDGFDYAKRDDVDPKTFKQIKYVEGGHGAGITYDAWQHISDFVISGRVRKEPENYIETRSLGMKVLGWFSGTIIIGMLLFLASLLYWLTAWTTNRHNGRYFQLDKTPIETFTDFWTRLKSSIVNFFQPGVEAPFFTHSEILPFALIGAVLFGLWFMARKF